MSKPSPIRTPHLFETFIDRDQAPMPLNYVPTAKGVLIAGEDLLRAAGYGAGSHRPQGWWKLKPGVFVKCLSAEFSLEVRQCGGWRTNMWTIERSDHLNDDFHEEALVCAFEYVPIWATTYQAAMRMAEYCHPLPQAPVAGCWIRAWH
jgi:hypothetical protein